MLHKPLGEAQKYTDQDLNYSSISLTDIQHYSIPLKYVLAHNAQFVSSYILEALQMDSARVKCILHSLVQQ